MTDESKTQRLRDRGLHELFPPEWHPGTGDGYVSAYRMIGVGLEEVSPPTAAVLGEVCVLMGWFALPRLSRQRDFDLREDGRIQINLKAGDGTEKRDPAPSSLFISPVEPTERGVIEAQARIHEAVSLISAVASMTLVFEHIEDYRIAFAMGSFRPLRY